MESLPPRASKSKPVNVTKAQYEELWRASQDLFKFQLVGLVVMFGGIILGLFPGVGQLSSTIIIPGSFFLVSVLIFDEEYNGRKLASIRDNIIREYFEREARC